MKLKIDTVYMYICKYHENVWKQSLHVHVMTKFIVLFWVDGGGGGVSILDDNIFSGQCSSKHLVKTSTIVNSQYTCINGSDSIG